MFFFQFKQERKVESFATEGFIQKWLTNDNGTLATYIKDGETEDVDLVKGRESLSESLGLWMEYALLKGDRMLFDDSYEKLNRYFLEENGFVNWKLTEEGKSEVFANALVDDLRISLALFKASEKWQDVRYEKTANQISRYVVKFNVMEHLLTDYYVKTDDYASEVITLSYIEPEALSQLVDRGLLELSIHENMMRILTEAPGESSFYPKSYHVHKKQYQYDTNINLIDQALVAFYRAKSGASTDSFYRFIKREFEEHNKVFGQYDRFSENAVVTYESPAIYAWLILYSMELGDEALALDLFERMSDFKVNHFSYLGGYSIHKGDTHIFDNIIPLLAERTLQEMGLI